MITSPPRESFWYRADVTRSTVPLLAGAERPSGKRRQVHVAGERKRKREKDGERVRERERRRRKGRERGGEREKERERKKENDCAREEEKETRGGRSSSFLFLRLDAIGLSFSPPRLLDFSVSSPSREPFRRTYVCLSVRLSFLDYLLFLTDVSCLLHYRRSECVSSSSPRRRLTSLLRSSLHRGCVGPSRAPTFRAVQIFLRATPAFRTFRGDSQ